MNSSSKKVDKKRRVVITGLGVVSSIGIGVEEFWKNLIAGKSGISEIESFDTSNFPVHKGGEVKKFQPEDFIDRRKIKHLGRASQLAIAATKLALQDTFLNNKETQEAGVFIGTTMGEIQELENININWLKNGITNIDRNSIYLFPTNAISINVAIRFNFNGWNFLMPTACAGGNYSLGYAFDLIKNRELDIAFAGGSDSLSRIAFTGFNRLLAMAPDKCQPFDKNRKGMMLGEGAGVVVLESLEHAKDRGAKIYAEMSGYGLSCDAHHMTQPTSEGVASCVEKALANSSITAEDIDYISAHGTGTGQNDKVECSAFKRIFGVRLKTVPCSSIKSMLGHTMGAASALETIACCLVLRDQIGPPTINYATPDEDCDIDCIPNTAKKITASTVLNNSCAFGGNNACLIFQKIG